jgi:hypothetical protein
MKTKLLSTLRKYYDYAFTKEGKVVTRNKKSGVVTEYDSIEDYVHGLSYSDTLINHLTSHKWNKKKIIIKEGQKTKDENYWNSLNKK